VLPLGYIRMVYGNWSQLCAQQRDRPILQLQQDNYGGCIFAVSALLNQ
jgi:hypothetical protein